LNNSSFSQRGAAIDPMAALSRLVRQVCLLRECGEADRAARLHEGELANAVRDHRLTHGPEALPESELRAMFATEERRVADAVILSELLAPRLVAAGVPAPAAGPRPVQSPPAAHRPAVPAGPPAISDLLDAMLAAERTGRHLASGKHES
jgi:hypothetical protein